MTVKITGSAPVRIVFTDDSVLDLAIDGGVLAAASYEAEYEQEAANSVHFADIVYPEDFAVVVTGETLTTAQYTKRLTSFMSRALAEAVSRLDERKAQENV